MNRSHLAKIANLLKISVTEATAYCEDVRRASGFGAQLSYATIARHLRGKEAPYPTVGALASNIKQQDTFRIRTGKAFRAHGSSPSETSSRKVTLKAISTAPRSHETLEKCPYCRKRFSAEDLPEHTKRFHASDLKLALKKDYLKTPLLDGVEVQSPDLIQGLKQRVINEQGFLVSPEFIPETKQDDTQERHFRLTGVSRNVEQSNAFDRIKSLDSKIPGARIKRLRPEPDQPVLCPICHRQTDYRNLFNHVAKKHPEENAKIVLAKFNRKYEVWARNRSSK